MALSKYPRLMISTVSGNVVLFTAHNIGTVVKQGPYLPISWIGKHSTDWMIGCFKNYDGDIFLTNDALTRMK